MLTWPSAAAKSRHQPGIGVECTGTKATNAPANVELSRNGALVTGEPLLADLYVGYVLPGAAFGDVFFGDADDTVLWLELGIHPLNDVANQRHLLVEFTERPQNPVAILVTGQREVLPPPDARGEVPVIDLVLHLATPCYVLRDR